MNDGTNFRLFDSWRSPNLLLKFVWRNYWNRLGMGVIPRLSVWLFKRITWFKAKDKVSFWNICSCTYCLPQNYLRNNINLFEETNCLKISCCPNFLMPLLEVGNLKITLFTQLKIIQLNLIPLLKKAVDWFLYHIWKPDFHT